MRKLLLLALLLSYFTFTGQAQTVAPSLGKAFPFTVLAKTGITSSGETIIAGNAGVAPSTTFTGFQNSAPGFVGPGIVIGNTEINNAVAVDAQADLVKAYNQAAGETPTQILTNKELGGKVLSPGVYRIDGDASLNNTLILENGGKADAIFIFQITGNLTTGYLSAIEYLEGAEPRIKNIFWQVAGTTTLGSFSKFKGTVLGQGNINVGSRARIDGRLLTHNGAIGLSGTTISIPTDLGITVSKTPGNLQDNYYVGQEVTYTIRAENLGPIDATNVEVAFTNEGLTYVSSNAPIGTSYNDNTKRWSISSLKNGDKYTFTITYRISESFQLDNNPKPLLFYSVSIGLGSGATGSDETPENNERTTTMCIAPGPPSTITGPAVACDGTLQTYSVAKVAAATQYNWTLPVGWSIQGPSTGSSIQVRVGPNPGNISVTAQSTCLNSTSAASTKAVTVTLSPTVAPGAITATNNGATYPCAGASNITYSVEEVEGALSYEWTVPSGWVITGDRTKRSITVTTVGSAGEISVRAMNTCGLSEKSAITVTPSLTTPTAIAKINGEQAPCAGITTTYSIPDGTGATSFTWTLPAGWEILNGAGTTSIEVKVGSTSGSISVSARNGCGASSASLDVNPTLTLVAANIIGELRPCSSPAGEEHVYRVDPIPGAFNYIWSVTGGVQKDLQILPGDTPNSIKLRITSNVTRATLSLQIINSCGLGEVKSITIDPRKTPPLPGEIKVETTKPCQGETIKFEITSVLDATGYEWKVPADWTITSQAPDGLSILVRVGNTAGSVSVLAKNDCGKGPEKSIALTPALARPDKPTYLTSNTNPCFDEKNVVYSVAADPNALSYAWKLPTGWVIVSGDGTRSIIVNPTNSNGSVEVIAKNRCGDSDIAKLDVIASTERPVTPGLITGSPVAPCQLQDNVSFSVDKVAGATSYKWSVSGTDWAISSGNGSELIKVKVGIGKGTISVLAVNGCGESTTARSIEVEPTTEKPTTPISITGRTAVCTGEDNITYKVSGMQNVTGYFWSINGGNDWIITSGQTSDEIKVKAGVDPAEISVVAINNCGQSEAKMIRVVTSTAIPATPGAITGTDKLCAGPNASLEYTITAVPGAISYVWTMPGSDWKFTQNEAGTGIVVTTVGTTSGKIKVRAVNGCGESLDREITVAPTLNKPAKPGNISTNAVSVCESQQSVVYFVPKVNGVTYRWEVPQGWVINSSLGDSYISVTVGKTAGNVSVTAVNNCGDSPASILAVAPSPIPSKPVIVAGQTLPCQNSTGNIYSVQNVPGTIYTWDVPSGWSITSGTGTSSITVAAGLGGGNITVTAGNDCGDSEPAVLAVSTTTTQPANPLNIQGSNAVCGGVTNAEYKVEPVANTSKYIWTLPAGWEILSGEGTNAIIVKPSETPGQVSVKAENGCGISTASSMSVAITGLVPPTPAAITGLTAPCNNTEGLNYTIAGVPGATQYVWTVPSDWTIVSGQGTTSLTVKTGVASGNVTVQATNNCGGGAVRELAVTTVVTPSKPLAITGDLFVCVNTPSVKYEIPAVAGTTEYVWTLPTGWKITNGDKTNSITVTIGTGSGQVQVYARNTCGNSEASSITVSTSVSPSPAPGPIQGEAVTFICAGENNLKYSIDPLSTASSYVWVVPADWEIISGQSTTSIIVKAGALSGNISVRGVNACGQSDASTLAVTINSGTSLPIAQITGRSEVCATQTGVQYSVPPAPGAPTYTWTLPTGWKITKGAGTNVITVDIGATSGAQTISVVAANSCSSSEIRSTTVNVTPLLLAPTIEEKSNSCYGLEFRVTPTPGVTSYNWEVPATWTITEGQGTAAIKAIAPLNSKPGTVSVTAHGSACSSETGSIVANPKLSQSTLEFANALSPNGDQVNDTWKIRNIGAYQENELSILNRWGSEVYSQKNYQNNWDGGQLSEGTYFYVFKVKKCDGSYESFKGFVMIIR